MKFGPLAVADAAGAILAHSVKTGTLSLKKGRELSQEDVAALAANDIHSVTAARLEPDDVHEDEAASRLGAVLGGPGLRAKAPFTGRVNLFAEHDGVLLYEPADLTACNRVDEAVTVAALPPWTRVQRRQMVATVKIIPFAVPEPVLAEVLQRAPGASFAVSAYRARRVALIQSRLPGMRETILDKTTAVLGERLAALGATLTGETRVAHDTDAVAAALRASSGAADLVLIAGASAIVDRRDVIPAAVQAAGGQVKHLGMPVDPGNLLLLAEHEGRAVLGLPGCARSPARNGVDLVLERLAADLPVEADDIMAMGVGGLLKEFAGRPAPRLRELEPSPTHAPEVAAVVLAAGQSRRMGSTNKLLQVVDGQAMVVSAVRAALAAGLPTTVVTGHESEQVRSTLEGLDVRFVHNEAYADGLSTSLACGLRALPENTDAAVVCLADMPGIDANALERLIAAFDPLEGRSICVPTWKGKRGNPVLWDRRYFEEMITVSGDTGARHLLGEYAEALCEVPMRDDAVLRDIDSPADLAAYGGPSQHSPETAHD